MTWKIKQTQKKFTVINPGTGSFTFNNQQDAKKLCTLLNTYDEKINYTINLETKLIKAYNNLIQSIMTLNILKADLDKIKHNLEDKKSRS